MRAGQDIHFRSKRTDLIHGAAVRTLAIFQDHLADGHLLEFVNRFADKRQPVFAIRVALVQGFRDLLDVLVANLFFIGEHGIFHCLGGDEIHHILIQFFRDHVTFVRLFLLAAFVYDRLNEIDHLAVHLMSGHDGIIHDIFRDFICTGFDHNNFLRRGSHGKSQIGFDTLFLGRIKAKLAVDQTDHRRGDGAVKGNVGNAGGNRAAEHSHYVRIAVGINTHDEVA